jgi:hypothetical protein
VTSTQGSLLCVIAVLRLANVTLKVETADFEAKTMRKVRQRIELAAAGGYLTGRHSSTRVFKWDPDGRNVRPGPGIITLILIIHIM